MAEKAFQLPTTSWRSNLYALYIVSKKDWYYFWRYPLNAISTILFLPIWFAPVYFMGQAFSVNGKALGFAGYTGSSDYVSFVLIGSVLTNYISTVFWNMGFSIKGDMDSGVLESNWLTPCPRIILLIGRTITSLILTTITSLVSLGLGAILFGFQPTGNALAAVLTLIPMLIGLYGFGIAFAAIVLYMRDANTIVDISSFLVNIFSGSQFPVQALPRWLLPVSLILPITYGLDAARGWLLKTNTVLPIQAETVLLIVFMFVMVWLGVWVFNRLERRVRQMGTLGQH